MRIEVVEFELICAAHGEHKTLVPVEFPRPVHCAHCFLPVTSRQELRRFVLDGPLPNQAPAEAFIG